MNIFNWDQALCVKTPANLDQFKPVYCVQARLIKYIVHLHVDRVEARTVHQEQ